MKRNSNIERDIADHVRSSERSQLVAAIRNCEREMDGYLPLPDEIPHDQHEREVFLLQNITGDPEMPPLKQMLRLIKRR
jgi:hypothetical protein